MHEVVVDALDMETAERVTVRLQCESTDDIAPHLFAHGLLPEGYHMAGQHDTDFGHPTLDEWLDAQSDSDDDL
jgi:hypothetical protein